VSRSPIAFFWKGGKRVPVKAKRYIPEFKDRAAKKVVDDSLPIAQVARELGVSGTTLSFWVKDYRKKLARLPPQDMSVQERIRELERRNRALEMENAFLRSGFVGTPER
jgi:transposase